MGDQGQAKENAPTPVSIQDEFMLRIGAKKEEFDWHPDIVGRRIERPKSSTSIDYRLDLKKGHPRGQHYPKTWNPWLCENQALRQMTLVTRLGPKRRFYSAGLSGS